MSSLVKITSIKMSSEDEAVPSEPMNAEIKVEETATDSEDPRDSESNRNLFSHHLGDKIKMGDCEEHGQSEMVTKRDWSGGDGR